MTQTPKSELNDRALSAARKLARIVFKKRGNKSEAHLREEELVVICATAFITGATWRDPRAGDGDD